MLLHFSLIALITFTAWVSPAIQNEEASTGVHESYSVVAETGKAGSAASRSAETSSLPSSQAVTVEEIDVIIPPVDPAVLEPLVNVEPEPQAARDEVVVDQLVTPERVESEVVSSVGFQTLGVTWPQGAEVEELGAQIRTSTTEGEWSGWMDLETSEDAPDAGTADSAHAVRGGTESIAIDGAGAVQFAFDATPEGGPDGLSLALIGSDESEPTTDRVVGTATGGEATVRSASTFAGVKTGLAPRVISRSDWGAPAQTCAPDVASKLVGAVVHHTAGSNTYSSVAQAMQQIRNDAAYHISGRGWCDIGYNFIVDKWGNIYEGRAKSLTQAVIGVHTGGFNTGTVGVSMLGTFDAAPSEATKQAVGEIIGWRLGAYGVDPQGSMSYYTGAGDNSRFANQNVSLPRVFGHRDTAYTACPGNGGYAALGTIRAIAAGTAKTVLGGPTGQFDSITSARGQIVASGWAIDPDTSSPIIVQMYLDGLANSLSWANLSRPDVGAIYPAAGANHGYRISMAARPGTHSACIYAINTGPGSSSPLGCRTVTVASTNPFGQFDSASSAPGSVTASGWAIDPDTEAPILVQMYLDGRTNALTWASNARPDITKAYPRAGPNHGFNLTMAATPGVHSVCLYAINTGPGASTPLGCRTITVASPDPFGQIDAISSARSAVEVSGWAIDANTVAPIIVQMYVDGRTNVVTWASQTRPDVASAYPTSGPSHGFTLAMPATRGAHSVCIYAINTGPGASALLGCRNVTVS